MFMTLESKFLNIIEKELKISATLHTIYEFHGLMSCCTTSAVFHDTTNIRRKSERTQAVTRSTVYFRYNS